MVRVGRLLQAVQESEGEDEEEVEDEGDDGTISEEEELYDNDDQKLYKHFQLDTKGGI